jgi:hypothetical protein
MDTLYVVYELETGYSDEYMRFWSANAAENFMNRNDETTYGCRVEKD